MIRILSKEDCCGCNACGDVCPRNSISFKTDIEGFWYPEVNMDTCIDCHLCEAVCPQRYHKELKRNEFEKPKCFAAVHKNLEVRFDSTSGGLFSAFAEQILKEGGLVGGAQYTDDLYVEQILISEKKELYKLRGSKYLQSNFSGFYKAVKQALLDGKKVLLCGSPCQMAALRRFLRKDYDNLFILDYICRGIPSGMLFHKYLEYWEKKIGSKVTCFKFKIKDLGWRKRTMKIGFKNGKYIYDDCKHSLYDLGYHKTHAFCRPSCYACKFIGFPRIADISIADFWGIENLNLSPDLDRNMGTSIVMCNNTKGLTLFTKITSKLVFAEVPFESTLSGNQALVTPHPQPVIERNDFYKRIANEDFDTVINDIIASNRSGITLKQKIKAPLLQIYGILKRHYRVICLGIGTYVNLYQHNSITSIFSLNKGILVKEKHTVFDVARNAKITVSKGVLNIGYKRIKGSELESRLLIESDAKLTCDGDFVMYYGANVEIFKGAHLHLKGNSGFNANCTIICAESITIGEHVAIGRNVTIRDNNGGHYISRQGYKNSRPVVIEDHAWLCEGCTIMPGVTIGTGAIVGAGAIVYSNVPPFTMVSGNPAKVVDTDIYWKA